MAKKGKWNLWLYVVFFVLGLFVMYLITFWPMVFDQPKQHNCDRAVVAECCPELNESTPYSPQQPSPEPVYTCGGTVPESAATSAGDAEYYCSMRGTCPTDERCISVQHHATLFSREYYTCECGHYSYGV